MSGALGKVSFDNGGAFIRETRREVEAYLSSKRTRVPARRLYAKAPIALGLMAVVVGVPRVRQPGPRAAACSRSSASSPGRC